MAGPSSFAPLQAARRVADAIETGDAIEVVGANGAARGLMLAEAYRRATPGRPLVFVAADDTAVRVAARDLAFFAGLDPRNFARGRHGSAGVLLVPEVETSPYADVAANPREVGNRLAALGGLADPELRVVFVSVRSLSRRVVAPEAFAAHTRSFAAGQELEREALLHDLVSAGYRRVDVVEDIGTFAVRGSVIDVFSPGASQPARMEFFGEELESIRAFDPTTQRSTRTLDTLLAFPVRETIRTTDVDLRLAALELADALEVPSAESRRVIGHLRDGTDFFGLEALAPLFHDEMAPLWSFFPEASAWFVEDAAALEMLVDRQELHRREAYTRAVADKRLVCPPEAFFVEPDALVSRLRGATVITARVDLYDPEAQQRRGLVRVEQQGTLEIRTRLERARGDKSGELLRPLVDAIEALGRPHELRGDELVEAGDVRGWRVICVAPNATHAERLVSLLRGYGLRPELVEPEREGVESLWRSTEGLASTELLVLPGGVSEGFRSERDRILLLSESDIFGRATRRRKTRSSRRGLTSLTQLQVGDYIVHLMHGVGRYVGMNALTLQGMRTDFALIEYAGTDKLYLPVHRLHEIERFVSAEDKAPKLDKLGGHTFAAKTKKIKQEVRQLAEELLQIYAQREAEVGHAFPERDDAYTSFEATFPFEETPDQAAAIEAVQEDLDAPRPMDRLVCGDVGFGKTEVALRAAFRVAMSGKQVAVLAPTTVLVQQHFLTFSERMGSFPIRVGVLNRFQSTKDRKAVVEGIRDGSIDVVVGTHRLLSKDVRFADLGLVVIDEEQRFGVAQKERFKKLKTKVDVLTLTATPIPRTLHMSLLGLREISMITTPPHDRLPVRTLVTRQSDAALEEGLKRELARGGQVFYVVPRVLGIEEHAVKIRELVPDARVVVAHGQMAAGMLEKTMVDFLEHRADVMVATTIIESGLDIPRANTMFIARADMFGLAQLYQLRGRIGRSKLRAHCYLMVNSLERLAPDAKRRLEAIVRNAELGAGFNVASQDLEIRGAGDLLGRRQHGNIAAIGFEAYARILGEAVAELRGNPISSELDPELVFDVPSFLPDTYIEDTGQRLDFYRRMSGARTAEEVREVMAELHDRFGELPVEARHFAHLMICKTYARRLHASTLEIKGSRCTLRVEPKAFGDRRPPRDAEGFVAASAERWVAHLPERTGEDCTRQLEAAQKALRALVTWAETRG